MTSALMFNVEFSPRHIQCISRLLANRFNSVDSGRYFGWSRAAIAPSFKFSIYPDDQIDDRSQWCYKA